MPFEDVATESYYHIARMEMLTIPAVAPEFSTREEAIAGIKAVLCSEKELWFAFFAPYTGWQQSDSFWTDEKENTVIDMDVDYDTQCGPNPAFRWQILDVRFRPPPVELTGHPSQVMAHTAIVSAVLDDDTAVRCNGRFEYHASSGSIYSFTTEWQPGHTSGEAFEAVLPALLPDTRHYFRPQARNSSGTAEDKMRCCP